MAYDAFGKGVVNLQINGIDTDINASSFSMTLFDSIYSFFPTAKVKINDVTGVYQEYMGFVNGTNVSLSLGLTTEDWKTCSYTVVKNSEPSQTAQNGLGSPMEISLIHDAYSKQQKVSAGFNSNISDIISDLVKKYNFISADIDTTLNSGLWYQPYVTDVEFIKKYLLPYAYSTQSDKTPFYAFITSNNEFKFKNYKQMLQQNPVKSFVSRTIGSADAFRNDSILKAVPVQTSVIDMKPYYNRMIYHWNEYGEFIKTEENPKLTDYPKGSREPIPIVADLTLLTNVVSELDNDILLDDNVNNRLGQEINPLAKAITTDKMIVSLELNRDICSGQIVNLNFPNVTRTNSTDKSLRSSGNYLVESCYHSWSGRDATTILICSKQTVSVNNTYRNRELILQR